MSKDEGILVKGWVCEGTPWNQHSEEGLSRKVDEESSTDDVFGSRWLTIEHNDGNEWDSLEEITGPEYELNHDIDYYMG